MKFYALFAFFNLIICQITFAGHLSEDQKLRLLTLNTWQFPYGIVSRDNFERADNLVTIIRRKQEEFDVIAFQELWSNETRSRIYGQISDLYPYQYEDDDWGYLVLGFHSGLALYSKYPIKRHMLHTYNNYRGIENLAKKGILGIELDIKGQSVYVFTTHLQAPEDSNIFSWWDKTKPNAGEIVVLQLNEARQHIDEFITDKTAPAFLMGDLNMPAEAPIYHKGLDALGAAYDTFDSLKSKEAGTFWINPTTKERIDYIFTLNHPLPGFSVIVDYFGPSESNHFSVSDHFGVMGIFDLTENKESKGEI